MKPFIFLAILFLLTSCGIKVDVDKAINAQSNVDNTPVTTNLIPSNIDEDVQGIITLVYNDSNGDLASVCSLSNLSDITITQACSCTLGVCTVGVSGTLNYNGGASFDYTVTAGGDVSNTSSAVITIDPVDDAPVISATANQTTNKNAATGAIVFTINDVDSAMDCTTSVAASSSDEVLIANSSIVFGGAAPICTMTLTPETDRSGVASITLTLSDGNSTDTDDFDLLVNHSGWYQEAYIKAVNAGTSDTFGYSVSLSGDTLAVGAPYEDSNLNYITNGPTATTNNFMLESGATYVYKRTGSTWAQEAYIKAANSNIGDIFGMSVALSGDTLAVGATGESSNQTTITNGLIASANNSSSASGATYIYHRTGSTWVQEAYIKASNSEAGDNFGSSVSISGNTLAVGAFGEDSNETSITNGATASANNSSLVSGATYIYKRTGSTWVQEAYLKASNAEAGDNFGTSVSLSGDTLAVGAYGEDSNETSITNGPIASPDNSNLLSGATYIFKRNGPTWTQEAYIKAANSDAGDSFGNHISLSGDTLAVGTQYESSNQATITNGITASGNNLMSESGAAYVYKRDGSTWTQEAYIKASNVDEQDNFGVSISLSGDTLAVGAGQESSNQTTITNGITASANNSRFNSGATYIFKRTGSAWAQEAYIKAVNADVSDSFGSSISLSGDTLAVGVSQESSNQTTITNGTSASSNNSVGISGATYIYRNNTRLFDPPEFTAASSSVNSLTFTWNSAGNKATGYKIAYVSGDTPPADCSSGTVVDVGQVLTYTLSGLPSGSQYSFRICSYDSLNVLSEGVTSSYSTVLGGWEQEAYIKAANADTNDYFGGRVFLNGDTLVVAATYEDSNQNTITNNTTASGDNSFAKSGAVYVYKRTGSSWAQEAYIKASNAESNDEFGMSLSVSGDTLAVGTPRESSDQITITNGATSIGNNLAGNSGAVYVYKRTGANWAQEAYIKALNADINDIFGVSVSLSGDTLAVGAPSESSMQDTITNGATASADNSLGGAGATYIYKRTGTTWVQEAYVKASIPDEGDSFGGSISLSGDTLAVGAVGDDSDQTTITNGAGSAIDNSDDETYGSTYIYKRTGTTWVQEAYIKPSNADLSDRFGSSISLSGDTLAVGTSEEDSNETSITNGNTASNDNSLDNPGAVYIFQRVGNLWEQQAYIKASNANSQDYFGTDVALSGDTLAVGAQGEDSNQTTITNGVGSANNTITASGATYIYKRIGSIWAQEAYIKASNSETNDSFGEHVSLSGDTLVASSRLEDSNQITITNGTTSSTDNSNLNSGAVFVYRNVSRLFAPIDFIPSDIQNNSITFAWKKPGSLTTGYILTYDAGMTPPASCTTGADVNVGNVLTYQVTLLGASSFYSFRICSYDAQGNLSEGITSTIETRP
jgi:hypothetical protein